MVSGGFEGVHKRKNVFCLLRLLAIFEVSRGWGSRGVAIPGRGGHADPERQREAVKVWQQAHPEKLKAYRKTMFMKNSIAKHRFPKQRSIQFHGLTDAEVIHLVENVLASLRASTEDELYICVKTYLCPHNPTPHTRTALLFTCVCLGCDL